MSGGDETDQPESDPHDATDHDDAPDHDEPDHDEPDHQAPDDGGDLAPATGTPPIVIDGEVRGVTRWDRPPPPRDWRFFVNRTGRVLIVTGLLMFGFVAYQLWGTGIQTARAQNRLEQQFEEALADAGTSGTVPATSAPTTSAPSSSVPTSVPTTATTAAPTTAAPTTAASTTSASTTSAPATSATITTAAPTTLPIAAGRALARLEIPKIGKSLYVQPGVDVATLHDGPGHYPDTPLPGQLGNSAIAGHRTTSGAPFGDIDELEPGDEIIVTMTSGDRFVYQVTESFIVDPSDYWVVATEDPTVAMLTLTSCHPEYTARQRIVVRSILKPAESATVGKPTYYDLDADRDPTPTATTVVDGVPIPVTIPGETSDTGDTGDAGALPGDDTPPAPDGLTAGWFQDRDAWPHILAWGAACLAIAWGATRLSRRFRSDLFGWSLAVLPLAVVLYFFYENVNRLLPAGL